MEKTKVESRKLANISLIIMLIGCILTEPFNSNIYIELLQKGFEAGLVGGLADWFAITALFRHPLGIPIPHTGLLPKNRNKIVDTLLNIVQNEWLNKETILEKTKNIKFSSVLFKKLKEELKKEEMKTTIKDFILSKYEEIDKDDIEKKSLNFMKKSLQEIKLEEITKDLLEKLVENKYHEKGYVLLLDQLETKLNDPNIRSKINDFAIKTINDKAKNGLFGIVLKPILSIGEEKIKDTINKSINEIIKELKDENSENRKEIIKTIEQEILKLKNDEKFSSKILSKKEEFINGKKIEEINHKMNVSIIEKIESYIYDEKFFNEKVFIFLENQIEKASNDKEFTDKIDKKSKEVIANLIENNHEKIGQLVKENLDKLSNEELIEMMENKIGKDLAWIRINGACCGFLIGTCIGVIRIVLDLVF